MRIKKQDNSVSLQEHYDRRVAQGAISDDTSQRKVLAMLSTLHDRLAAPRLFRKKRAHENGLYIWGNVGRGKSMLMDLFFAHVPVAKKKRVHFHAFMQDVHARLHELRKHKQSDPVALLARELAEDTTLLCFDELQATDVADATLLYRLFSGLFDAGVTIVSTSNHPPTSLYTGGVQKERFGKFIALIEEKMQVAALSSPSDYRHMQLRSLRQVWFSPLGSAADAFMDNTLAALCPGEKPKNETLTVQGRKITFLLYGDGIGRFTFHELCEIALGPADYLAIARKLDTLALTGIPALSPEKRNEAKRFVTLIDALYEQKVLLIATADTSPEGVYAKGDGSFEFARTISRLAEMQSAPYIQANKEE